MEKCKEDGTGMKAAFSAVRNKLLSLKLASEGKVVNKAILVHPENRFGAGLDVSDVHCLLDLIVAAGWDSHAVGPSLCFELPQGAAGIDTIEFNKQLVEASDGFLAPISKETVGFLSVSSSHTTAMLNAVTECLPHFGAKKRRTVSLLWMVASAKRGCARFALGFSRFSLKV